MNFVQRFKDDAALRLRVMQIPTLGVRVRVNENVVVLHSDTVECGTSGIVTNVKHHHEWPVEYSVTTAHGIVRCFPSHIVRYVDAIDARTSTSTPWTAIFSVDGEQFYDTHKVWAATDGLPTEEVSTDSLAWMLDESWWADVEQSEQSGMRRIEDADLSYPILVVGDTGEEIIADGMHRLAKAVRSGLKTITLRRIPPDVLEEARFHTYVVT
jgi:hypothetical protein